MQDLFKNYDLQIKDYKKVCKSKIWNEVLDKSFNDLDADKLNNFFSNRLSDGIANSRFYDENTIKIKFSELCKKYKENEVLNLFVKEENNVGNIKNYFPYQGRIITNNQIDTINFYLQIEKYLEKKKNIILEIGGGYGGLARIISENKKCTYILIDLPEINLISSFYLTSHFPDKKFLLYKDYIKNEKINFDDYDFIILPPWSSVNNIKYDFCINIRSMMEMSVDSIIKYFSQIQDNLNESGYFLNVNRYYSYDNNYNFFFHKFPYDKKWKIIKSETSWLQKNIHLLLTQRTKENFDDIENIFKKLKVFTENRIKYKKNIYYKIKIFIKSLFKRNRLKQL